MNEGTDKPEREINFAAARSFDELYEILREVGVVQGSKQTYETNDLISLIEEVRAGSQPTTAITRTSGLRDVVEKLIGRPN